MYVRKLKSSFIQFYISETYNQKSSGILELLILGSENLVEGYLHGQATVTWILSEDLFEFL